MSEPIDFDQASRCMWFAHVDTVRLLAPVLDVAGLAALAADLRPGSGGRWEGLPAPLDAFRALLLAEVADAAERLTGAGTWPIRSDIGIDAPDDISELSP